MLELPHYLIFYTPLPNGNVKLVYSVGFTEVPNIAQIADVLNNDHRVAELDHNTLMMVANREIAMVAFGISQNG